MLRKKTQKETSIIATQLCNYDHRAFVVVVPEIHCTRLFMDLVWEEKGW